MSDTPVPIPDWAVGAALELLHCTDETLTDRAATIARHWSAATQERVCAFCGQAYPPGTPAHSDDRLAAHIRVCTKHPMREVELQRDRLHTVLAPFVDYGAKHGHCDLVGQRGAKIATADWGQASYAYRDIPGLPVVSWHDHAVLRAKADKLRAHQQALTWTLRATLHTLETIDADERFAAREEGRLAHVHASAIKQAQDALAEHGSGD